MAKRKMSENSLKNLTPITERSEKEQRKMRSKGGKKSGETRRKKIKRENAKEWLWDEYGIDLSAEVLKNGTTKDKLDLLKAILPTDKQTNELIGKLGVEKIFITPQEHQETMEHIQSVINDGITE